MAPGSNSPASSVVIFPISEERTNPASPVKAPHLPFRRISLPAAPSPQHRVSVASIASFDSENDVSVHGIRDYSRVHGKSAPGRRISVDSPRRRKRSRVSSVVPEIDNRQIAQRRMVVEEFYETEKAYVNGLELIYSHFLTPIIASLDLPEPLLTRTVLTSIFSNFIDIWNLHRSFLSSLTTLLDPVHVEPTTLRPLPNLSPLLLSHFPYLSLYTPFVTSFPSTISALNELITPFSATRSNPLYNHRFANFLAGREAHPRCGKLKLRDWLLTIVQRCPRYLLLLKDLINSTRKDDPEHSQLISVLNLVSKITLSLNTSLHTHAQTMALLALQRSTPNLPFQLITPGRAFLKRGTLIQIERSGAPLEREFLLFSDCLIWLAAAESSGNPWDWNWSGSGSESVMSQSRQNTPASSKLSTSAVPMTRSRSKSEAALSNIRTESSSITDSHSHPSSFDENENDGVQSIPVSPTKPRFGGFPPPLQNMSKRRVSSDDKMVYKGRVDLVDVEVVVGSSLEDERKFEILSPESSFAVYASSEEERNEWTTEIRSAKAQLLVSLNVTNPNSTLTSSESTNHVRRALQALPYPPSDVRVASIRASSSLDLVNSPFGKNNKSGKKDKAKRGISAERRMKVEHWVPAIWIPDNKTASCMRCGRMFGWRRRRHHCRLCGRCVCSSCSGRTFFIADSNRKSPSSKPARACDACYETVFPLVDPPEPENHGNEIGQIYPVETQNNNGLHNSDTIASLSRLPSWLSMPALPVQRQPQALMAIDLNSHNPITNDDNVDDSVDERERRSRGIRTILEDFREQAKAMKQEQNNKQAHVDLVDDDDDERRLEEYDDDVFIGEDQDHIDVFATPPHSLASSPISSPRKVRIENTARRSKRFSLPAIALHTANVTARTAEAGPDSAGGVSRESSTGEPLSASSSALGRSKRFSLVLAGRTSSPVKSASGDEGGGDGLAKGAAAARLSELLARKTKA